MYSASIRKSVDANLWVAELENRVDKQDGPVLAIVRKPVNSSTSIAVCYSVADTEGQILRSGRLSDCAGCHDGAPNNGVFSSSK